MELFSIAVPTTRTARSMFAMMGNIATPTPNNVTGNKIVMTILMKILDTAVRFFELQAKHIKFIILDSYAM